ncbi:type II toxin-antitoxin system prevent-host-death family antitoxin [Synechococcus sp. BA-132 BA5]|nr:type II toxin-antitoxin system prevent-host-death family antitoxin [Synechococcus sp. BA-132 BA5]
MHQAKPQLSRLIDDAHAGETIVLAKAGKPWARLMPLEAPAPQRPLRLPARQPCPAVVVVRSGAAGAAHR